MEEQEILYIKRTELEFLFMFKSLFDIYFLSSSYFCIHKFLLGKSLGHINVQLSNTLLHIISILLLSSFLTKFQLHLILHYSERSYIS